MHTAGSFIFLMPWGGFELQVTSSAESLSSYYAGIMLDTSCIQLCPKLC